MRSIQILSWILKISGALYVLISLAYLIPLVDFSWPRDWNHVLLMLQQPSNLVSAIVHGLGAIALGVVLERFWNLRAGQDAETPR